MSTIFIVVGVAYTVSLFMRLILWLDTPGRGVRHDN